jgi:hypothetical protein
MFKARRAQMALLITMHDELIKKLDEQIKVEREFINKLEVFMAFETKVEAEKLRREEQEELKKRISESDRKY